MFLIETLGRTQTSGAAELPIAYLVGLWAKLFLDIDLRDASPLDRIRATTVPILVIHLSADAVIPFSHARSLQQALGKIPRLNFGSMSSSPMASWPEITESG